MLLVIKPFMVKLQSLRTLLSAKRIGGGASRRLNDGPAQQENAVTRRKYQTQEVHVLCSVFQHVLEQTREREECEAVRS